MKTIAENVNEEIIRAIRRITPFTGNTPLFPLTKLFQKKGVNIFAKLEWNQMGNSVKARPAFNMMSQAVYEGKLGNGRHLLDATSGNTGVAYATFGAALGIPVTICLPENASSQKIASLKALGANLIFTSKFETTDGAQEVAAELAQKHPEKYYYANQYANDNNWKAHYFRTAKEILRQTNQKVTHFVAGLGTTGTFTGTGRGLIEAQPDINLISVQPDTAMHGLEGWKHLETAKVPTFYDAELAHQNITVDTFEAYALIKEVAEKEGLLLSPSSAANLAAAIRTAQQIDKGAIVTVFPDHGSNYPEIMKELF